MDLHSGCCWAQLRICVHTVVYPSILRMLKPAVIVE